jgi:hypothetical protein
MPTLIRPLAQHDIPQLVSLRRRCFRFSETPSPEALGLKFKDIFIDNPWRDESLPSLVHVDEKGLITGFLGVVPRPMSMNGARIRAAIATQFMVEPGKRGLTGVRLLKRFFAGPQDVSLSDVSNDESLTLWEGHGGTRSLLHSIHWTQPLRLSRYAIHLLRLHGLPRSLSLAARPLCSLLDGILARVGSSVFRQSPQPPSTADDDPNVEQLVDCMTALSNNAALVPVYDRFSLQWLLQRLGQKHVYGRLRKAVVRGERKEIIGWYLYFLNPGGVSQVIQVAASNKAIEKVLSYLSYDAWYHGAVALSGRLDPRFSQAFAKRGVIFHCDGPWVVAHSHSREVLEVIRSGGAAISRLDAEWWLSF